MLPNIQAALQQFKNIPAELRALNQWVLWKAEDIGAAKFTKVPYQINGSKASVTNSQHWSSFDDCVQAYSSGNFSGIGFVFSTSDPYTFIDLDHSPDPLITKRQHEIYGTFNSYSELSPSGQGLHIIVKGSVPQGRRRNSIEIYSTERYATFTGNVYLNEPIKECQNELMELWESLGNEKTQQFNFESQPEKISDAEIIRIASEAANGDKFQRLYKGDWGGIYPSQSEADFSLINMIEFYTKNQAQVIRIFRMSELGKRDKAKRSDYIGKILHRSFDRELPPIDMDSLKIEVEKEIGSVAQRLEPTAHNGLVGGSSPPIPTIYNLNHNAERLSPPSTIFKNPPPGLLGEIAQFIYAAAPRPVPEIAIAAAIGLMAGICGRAYNVSSTGLNQYVLLLAKCHAKGTKILMYNGSLKNVEDIIIGDQVMGPDSQPRNVLRYGRGRETMVKVIPTKGEEFIVNLSHILSLKTTTHPKFKKGEIVNMSVKDYIETGKTFKHLHKLWRTGVGFKEKALPIDPWFLGALLGDGQLGPRIALTSMDDCIRNKAKTIIEKLYMKVTTQQVLGNKAYQDAYVNIIRSGWTQSKLQLILKDLGLWLSRGGDKFIPEIYKTGSREQRLQILAGLMDTDGHLKDSGGYEFVSKSKRLAQDVIFISRSLGFAAYISETEKYAQNGTGGIYHRVHLGGGLDEIPVTLEYKKAKLRLQKKDVLVTGFKTEILPEDDYYGFELDGDHLYLTSDYVVHHNTGRGKEAISSGINKIVAAVRQQVPSIEECIGPDEIASGPALYKYLNKNQGFVSVLSEFGLRLASLSDSHGNGSNMSLRRMILQLYAKSGFNDVAHPSIYSDKDKNIAAIPSPAFSILGESTPHTFYKNLNEEMISEGLLPRFLLIEYDGERVAENVNHAAAVPSNDLVDKLAQIAANAATVENSQPRRVITVNFSSEAAAISTKYSHRCDKFINNKNNNEVVIELWNRAHLKVLKLAAIVSVGINMWNPTIEKEAIEWAIDMVDDDIKTLTAKFDSGKIGANTQEIKQIEEVQRVIKEYVTAEWKDVLKYCYPKDKQLHTDKVISYGYISKRLVSNAAFRVDKMGATFAIQRTIKILMDRDHIQELSREQLKTKFGTTQKSYMITNVALLSEGDG